MAFAVDLTKARLVIFDFDGVFTDNFVWVSQDGKESVRCCRSDGLGLHLLRDAGIPHLVLSTETNPVVSARCKKMGIRCIQGCSDKLTAIKELLREYAVDRECVVYVGNDINDLPAMRYVGLPVAVSDAWPVVKTAAKWVTERPGGYGAVREVCELITNRN